ncbi:MAG: (4Fe-4S)-binding protein [Bacteroidetes bacterium RIFOXYA12_FULL_35_11]|nr:MAG: (4Fe-4S)-binding protein [Bacteroidetes bacterium GWF2_35_48]OFY75613.1 MAG: (4Fe-4S)-binding protein [Bacteroidetes bacterium RIFOXYA12_FULL_35_11]OFY94682.1 MAG: (4Fe-4S)-binding protein [Bacteroidetes bacterium RIFOXYB2_FULL_35_7]OFY94923.1 MAG: (4Fe-4S)-binding protein [Bacteroidetes bacterium RIFOXYC12_FULL_35_7]HBX52072.1 (4Fe-4S)-binding protein [Bacteroidales bacterium]
MKKDFGYSINKDRQIDFDKTDKWIYEYLKKHEPTFKLCIGCGSCTATCSAGNFTDFNLRRLFTLIHRGYKLDMKDEITKCMLCGKCILVCPRGVNTRNIILKINEVIENRKRKK